MKRKEKNQFEKSQLSPFSLLKVEKGVIYMSAGKHEVQPPPFIDTTQTTALF